MLIVIPCFIILALMPFNAHPEMVSYHTKILGGDYHWSHSVIYQIFEIRYCPIYAILLFFGSWFILWMSGQRALKTAHMLFAAGLGPFGFGMFRLALFAFYKDNLTWFSFWEEMTELLFILAVIFVLWIFRRSLFPHSPGLKPSPLGE